MLSAPPCATTTTRSPGRSLVYRAVVSGRKVAQGHVRRPADSRARASAPGGLDGRGVPAFVGGEGVADARRQLSLDEMREGVGGLVQEHAAMRARCHGEVRKVERAHEPAAAPRLDRETTVERRGDVVVHAGPAAGDAHASGLGALGEDVEIDSGGLVAPHGQGGR